MNPFPYLPCRLFMLNTVVDQVHFEDLYQVHRPCPRSPSEPH